MISADVDDALSPTPRGQVSVSGNRPSTIDMPRRAIGAHLARGRTDVFPLLYHQLHNAVAVRVRQGRDEQSMHYGEDCGVRANAERERGRAFREADRWCRAARALPARG
jgi:hypothetical protein